MDKNTTKPAMPTAMLKELPLRLFIEIAALIFAAGITYSAITTNRASISANAIAIQILQSQLSDHSSILAQNVTEHKYIIKALDGLVEKIEPIVEVAVRGNEHMADDDKHLNQVQWNSKH